MFEPVTERFETVGFEPLQKVWVADPPGADGVEVKSIVTLASEVVQGALAIVHCKEYEFPVIPEKFVVGKLTFVNEPPIPETILQVPDPTIGVFPDSEVVVVPQTF
jgi:hypothetical protein